MLSFTINIVSLGNIQVLYYTVSESFGGDLYIKNK